MEIRVNKHDGDVRFKSGNENTSVTCMHNAFDHNYRNSSFIVDLAMGQMPRSAERIYSYNIQYNKSERNYELHMSQQKHCQQYTTQQQEYHMPVDDWMLSSSFFARLQQHKTSLTVAYCNQQQTQWQGNLEMSSCENYNVQFNYQLILSTSLTTINSSGIVTEAGMVAKL